VPSDSSWQVVGTNTKSIQKATDTLYRAFLDDPVIDYLLPPPKPQNPSYDTARRKLYDIYLRLTQTNGYALTHNFATVALWLPPGKEILTPFNIIYRGYSVLVWSSIFRVISYINEIEKGKQESGLKSQYYVLFVIGTTPEDQGKGLMKHVMYPILEKADKEGVQIWLEATKLSIVPIYERFGFKQVKTVFLDKSSQKVPLVFMIHEPHGGELSRKHSPQKTGNRWPLERLFFGVLLIILILSVTKFFL